MRQECPAAAFFLEAAAWTRRQRLYPHQQGLAWSGPGCYCRWGQWCCTLQCLQLPAAGGFCRGSSPAPASPSRRCEGAVWPQLPAAQHVWSCHQMWQLCCWALSAQAQRLRHPCFCQPPRCAQCPLRWLTGAGRGLVCHPQRARVPLGCWWLVCHRRCAACFLTAQQQQRAPSGLCWLHQGLLVQHRQAAWVTPCR